MLTSLCHFDGAHLQLGLPEANWPLKSIGPGVIVPPSPPLSVALQGWQYGTVGSKFAYFVPRTLNRTVPAYRTLVQFLKRRLPYLRTVPVPLQTRRTVLLIKIEAYRTVLTYLPYRTAILAFSFSLL